MHAFFLIRYAYEKQAGVCDQKPASPATRSFNQRHVVRELVKHLLYMRNQIPGLFEDLDWQVQARSKRDSCLLPENAKFVTEKATGPLAIPCS